MQQHQRIRLQHSRRGSARAHEVRYEHYDVEGVVLLDFEEFIAFVPKHMRKLHPPHKLRHLFEAAAHSKARCLDVASDAGAGLDQGWYRAKGVLAPAARTALLDAEVRKLQYRYRGADDPERRYLLNGGTGGSGGSGGRAMGIVATMPLRPQHETRVHVST